MLFLYRPRQTYMPYSLPKSRTKQAAYNRQLQAKFDSTRRLPRPVPSPTPRDRGTPTEQLEALRSSGVLTDAEYEAAKTKLPAP
jgi:hypothetical protein